MPFTFQFGGSNAFGGGFNPESFQGGGPNPCLLYTSPSPRDV